MRHGVLRDRLKRLGADHYSVLTKYGVTYLIVRPLACASRQRLTALLRRILDVGQPLSANAKYVAMGHTYIIPFDALQGGVYPL